MHVTNRQLHSPNQILFTDMALLLCIDTSTTHASVALAKDAALLGIKTNKTQKDHGSFLQPAIKVLLQETGFALKDLEAIAVTSGPGSYTGLRVGFASAKGLCYALNLPLITIPTTVVMSEAARKEINTANEFILCPMIDARRMEVFTCLYTAQLDPLTAIAAKILEPGSFTAELDWQSVYFFGDGSAKWQTICQHPGAHFLQIDWNASDMTELAEKKYGQRAFTSLAYSAPEYGKEFHSTQL